jgi:predicted secreted protein
MFVQYGVTDTEIYSELFTVNVSKNSYVKDGVVKKSYRHAVSSQEDGTGALYSTIASVSKFAEGKGIDFLQKGRCLYLDINGDTGSSINFRDFKTNKTYNVVLDQKVSGSGKTAAASFSIDLGIKGISGKQLSYKIGNPSYMRKGISNYRIKKVVISPDEKGLVFVIAKTEENGESVSLRYMIETLRF